MNPDHLEALESVLREKGRLTVPAGGLSMGARFAGVESVTIAAMRPSPPRIGEIVVFRRDGRWVAHRLVARLPGPGGGLCVTKGDGVGGADRPAPRRDDCLGLVVAVTRDGRVRDLTASGERLRGCGIALRGLAVMAIRGALARLRQFPRHTGV